METLMSPDAAWSVYMPLLWGFLGIGLIGFFCRWAAASLGIGRLFPKK